MKANAGNRVKGFQRDKIQQVMEKGWDCIHSYLKSPKASPKDKAYLATTFCKRQIANITKETGNTDTVTIINLIKESTSTKIPKADTDEQGSNRLEVQPEAVGSNGSTEQSSSD